jgi:DMSO/TMAO reductase YedYZ heme-binding membrane subunit
MMTEKTRFCSFYLLLLFVDSVIVVLRNILSLTGVDLSQTVLINIAEGIFSFIFVFLAIAQVVIALKNKLKWAAKLIGLYPLFFTIVAMVIGIGMLITGRPRIDSSNASRFAVGLSVYLLVVGVGQLSVGIWAAKNLASGHYASAPSGNQSTIRND